MKKLNHLTFVAFILLGSLFFTSCNNQELTEQEKSEISKEIEDRVYGYAEACKQLDGEYMKGFWADTDDFVFAGDGTLMHIPAIPDSESCFNRTLSLVLSGHLVLI